MGLFDRGVKKTKEGFFQRLSRSIMGKSKVDDSVLDAIEEALVASDMGVDTTLKVVDSLEERVGKDKYMSFDELVDMLRDEIGKLLDVDGEESPKEPFDLNKKPLVVMVVGAFGRPHPSLLRLGGAGCGAEMFAGSSSAETAVDARTVAGQRRMPSSLAAGDKVAISFSVDAYTAGLPQLLRVLSAADSCEGALAAALDGEPVGSLDLKPGMLSLLYVPGQNLTVGTHTLTVRRTDVGASALRLDRVELGGSRRFGLRDGGWREDTAKESFSEADYFAFDGNLRNLRYAVTKTADLRIHLDLDAEVAANCPLTYRAKMAGSPVTAYNERRELQINGTCAYADLSTNAEFSVRLPRASLKAGENTFDWHYVEPKAETPIWWTFDYHEFVVGKPRAGLCVIVR